MNRFQKIFDAQKALFATGVTRTYEWRVDQLDRMARMIGENEQRFIAADSGVGGGGSLKADDHARGHMEAGLCPIDCVDRLPKRGTFGNIEGYSYHGKLTLV